MDVTIIGHGSLMSGLGLSSSGTFQVSQARVVALAGCRRGFAKLSRYGDRFATDLEVTRLPLQGCVMSPAAAPSGEAA
jgi:predicted metal-binding membrane protein